MLIAMAAGMMLALIFLQWAIATIPNARARLFLLLAIPPASAVFFTKPFLPNCCAFYMTNEPLLPNFPISPMEMAGWWLLYQMSLAGALVISKRPRWLMLWVMLFAAAVCLYVEQMGSTVGFWHWHVLEPGDPNFRNPEVDRMTSAIPFPPGHAIFGWVALRAVPMGMICITVISSLAGMKLRFLFAGLTTVVAYLLALIGLVPLSFPLCIIGAVAYGYVLGRFWTPQVDWDLLRPRSALPVALSAATVTTVCTVLLLIVGKPFGLLLGLPLDALTALLFYRWWQNRRNHV
jgi:hypothetical protein